MLRISTAILTRAERTNGPNSPNQGSFRLRGAFHYERRPIMGGGFNHCGAARSVVRSTFCRVPIYARQLRPRSVSRSPVAGAIRAARGVALMPYYGRSRGVSRVPWALPLPRVLSARLRAFYGNGGGRSNGGGRVAFSHSPISSQRRRRARSVALHPIRVHAFPFPYQGGTGGAGGITAGRYNGGGVTCRGHPYRRFNERFWAVRGLEPRTT